MAVFRSKLRENREIEQDRHEIAVAGFPGGGPQSISIQTGK
jgi:hypothetical protein